MNEITKSRFEVVVTSHDRNKNRDDEIKKHSRTSPEIQFKELNEKLRITLPEQQINSMMPAKTQSKSYQKIEKQTSKKTIQMYNH